MTEFPESDVAICIECGKHFDADQADDDDAAGGRTWAMGYSCAQCVRESPYEARVMR